jgi:hypothetical protein
VVVTVEGELGDDVSKDGLPKRVRPWMGCIGGLGVVENGAWRVWLFGFVDDPWPSLQASLPFYFPLGTCVGVHSVVFGRAHCVCGVLAVGGWDVVSEGHLPIVS